MSKLEDYVKKDRNKVKGWLTWIDAEIISSLLLTDKEDMQIKTALEIGVHRGKSAVLMLLGPNIQRLVAIDLFENQGANTDQSGRGNLQEFQENLSRFNIDSSKVSIIAADSTSLSASEIINKSIILKKLNINKFSLLKPEYQWRIISIALWESEFNILGLND